MKHPIFAVVLSSALLVALVPRPASAQTPNASEVSVARDQFRAGLEAARAGHWNDALQNFTRSYELLPRPLTLLNLAGAQVQSGRLVQGAESYRRFLNEATEGPAAQHRPAAQAALDEVNARIPRARVTADAALPDDQMTLDGQRLSRAMLGVDVPVDPGTHVVVVTRGGVEVGRSSFAAVERGRHDVRLSISATVPRTQATGGTTGNDRPGSTGTGAGTGTDSNAGSANTAGGSGSGDDSQRSRAWTRTDDGLAPRPAPGRSVVSSPWFWIGMGAVLAAGGVAGYFIWNATAPGPYTGNVPPYRVEIR